MHDLTAVTRNLIHEQNNDRSVSVITAPKPLFCKSYAAVAAATQFGQPYPNPSQSASGRLWLLSSATKSLRHIKPMILFSPYPDVGANDDNAVVCHEIGHAVAWFSFGGAVGSTRLYRGLDDEGMEADILLLPRDGIRATQENEAHYTPYSVRLLAGDVAYRKAMGMSEGKISLRGFPEDTKYTLEDILQKLQRDNRKDDDIYRIVTKALQAAPSDPMQWLFKHLSDAINVINAHWEAIIAIANRLKTDFPLGGQETCIPGTTLITWMMNEGLKPGQYPPLEIIDREEPTRLMITVKRFFRRLRGRHGVLKV